MPIFITPEEQQRRRRALIPFDILLTLGLLWVAGLAICQPLCALPLTAYVLYALWQFTHRDEEEGGHRPSLRLCGWLLLLLEIAAFFCLPNPQGPWQSPWARPTEFTREGDSLHLATLRDFEHRSATESEARYAEADADLSTICGASIVICRSSAEKKPLHTMLRFTFRSGHSLIFSPECRLPEGLNYHSLFAPYKKYGLMYLFATERDLLRLHSAIRREQVVVYPLRATPQQARFMLTKALQLAREAEGEHSVYFPMLADGTQGITEVLHILCPKLPQTLHYGVGDLISWLYTNNALLTEDERDTWQSLTERGTIAPDLAPAENYEAAVQQQLELPEWKEPTPEEKKATSAAATALAEPTDRPNLAADIPEPRARLAAEPVNPTAAADIPEPRARLEADTANAPVEPQEEPQTDATEDTPQPEEGTIEPTEPAIAPAPTTEKKALTTYADIPEPTQRLDADRQNGADANGAGRSFSVDIPEPTARLAADRRSDTEESTQTAAQTAMTSTLAEQEEDRLRQEEEAEAKAARERRTKGIIIRTKERKEEEYHPLDPPKRKPSPLDIKKKQENPQPDNPFYRPPIQL